jgi:hypothetical protein
VPEDVGELDCLLTGENEDKEAAVVLARVGVEGDVNVGVAGVLLPNNEGRPPVDGDVCKEVTVWVPLSLTKLREPTIPYAAKYQHKP